MRGRVWSALCAVVLVAMIGVTPASGDARCSPGELASEARCAGDDPGRASPGGDVHRQATVTQPAVWASLYQNHWPQAVYDEEGNTTYLAYLGDKRDLYAIAFDHDAGATSVPERIDTNPNADNPHSAPTLDMTPDGRLHIFWGAHSDAIRHVRSNNPRDLTSWTVQDLGHGSYPVTASDPATGDQYLLYRAGFWHNDPFPSHEYAGLQTSTDGGRTWSDPRPAIDTTGHPANDTDAYVNAASWHDGGLHLTWQIAYGRGHDDERADLYHAVYEPGDDAWRSLDGTDLGAVVTWEDHVDHAQVIRADGTGASSHYVGDEGIVLAAAFDQGAGAKLHTAKWDEPANRWTVTDTGIDIHNVWTRNEILPDPDGGWMGYFSVPSRLDRYSSPTGAGDWTQEEVIIQSQHNNPHGTDRMVRTSRPRNGGPVDVFMQDGGWTWYGGVGWTPHETYTSRAAISAVSRDGFLFASHQPWRIAHYARGWYHNFARPNTGVGYRQRPATIGLKGFAASDSNSPLRVTRLPVGYRPDERQIFETFSFSGRKSRVDVEPSGWVRAIEGDAVTLDGVGVAVDPAAWGSPVLEPGWSHFGSDLSTPGYRRTGDAVRLKGVLRGPGGGSDIFRLPPELRPDERHIFKVFRTGRGPSARVDVRPDGWVHHVEGGHNISLDGIEFTLSGDGWQDVDLAPGWTHFGSDLTTPQYKYDPDTQTVRLKGFLRGPVGGGGSNILRLPPSLRLDERYVFSQYRTGAGDPARIDVRPDGVVRHVASGDNVGLDGIEISLKR